MNERIQPPIFTVKPTEYTVTATIPIPSALQTQSEKKEKLKLKLTQLPVIINNATTGHKLQGSSVTNLFVHAWSRTSNWVYVVLSRVRTRSGLFIRDRLKFDRAMFAVPESLKKMMELFERKRPTYWTDAEYEQKFDL